METVSIPREEFEVLKAIADALKQIVVTSNVVPVEPQIQNINKIYNFKQAASLLGMNVKSLYEMVSLGHIKTVQRTAKQLGITQTEIDRYFRSSAGEQLRTRRR